MPLRNGAMTVPITETTATDCLLVVDANEAEVRALGSMLAKLGFEILPATNGTQAMEVLGRRRPDLILLDLDLPGRGGFELCRQIQESRDWAEIPIIFLSEEKDKDLIVRALESGGVDYITKPFHKQELLSRVRTHLMLKTSRDYAKRLAQDKDEMLGMISHYLQNHLVGINMSAQLLLDRAHGNADPKLRLMAENILSSSVQMRAFVKAFLANTAADHGLKINLENLCLADAARRAIQPYMEPARAKDITIRTEIPDEQMMIRADSHALSQVLDNLLSNAIKFSPPGEEVLVTVSAGPTHMDCIVRDHGAGFTAEDKANMFRRYARLSAQPTGGEPSTGLGLSIARRLAQAMNSELLCESTPPHGATFVVRLPRAIES